MSMTTVRPSWSIFIGTGKLMLSDGKRSSQRSLYLQIGNDGLRRFLSALLSIWSFSVSDDPHTAQLVLAEEGGPLPPGDAPVLWLTPCASSAADHLTLPASLVSFSAALEQAFHRPPRSHLRIAGEIPLAYAVRDTHSISLLLSFSDHGARFFCARELAPGEIVTLRFSVLDCDHVLAARVIYSFAEADVEVPRYSTGVIFSELDDAGRQLLRDQIVTLYLLQLHELLPAWAFTVGLSAFQIPDSYRPLFRA